MPSRNALAAFYAAFSLLMQAARSTTVLSVLVNVVGAVASAAMLGIAGKLLGLLAAGTTWSAAVPWLLASAVALAANMVTSSLHREVAGLAVEQVTAHAVGQVLDVAALVPYPSFDDPAFYDRMRRAYESGSEHAWSIANSTLSLVRSVLNLVAVIVVLAFVAPVLIVISIAAYAPLWVITVTNNRILHRFSWEETEGDRQRSYIESLLSSRQAAKEIRSFALAPELLNRYRDLWQQRISHLSRVVRGAAARSAVGYFLSSLTVTAALAIVVWLTIQGDLTLEQAGVGVLGVRQLSNGVNQASSSVASLHRSSRFLGDFTNFGLEAERLAPEPSGAPAPTQISAVSVEGVDFTYPGSERPALADLNLTIRSGELTAIVGANGSGKTTLMMLLAGLYEPGVGKILWNGTAASSIDSQDRQRAVSTLFQDYVHFHFSVAENVAFLDGKDDGVRDALKRAGALEFVDQLPSGTRSQLGKEFADGAELSVGQWQRLALARALYRPTPILLLDEPAASLDPGAESRLVARLKSECADRCVVMISHRFASVRRADRIFVLDEGRLIEHGTHDDLMANRGAYRALFLAQSDAGSSPDHPRTT